MMARTVGGDTVLFHTGARAGYGSEVLIVPSRRFASVTLTNRSSAMLRDWNRAAAGRLAGIEIPESGGEYLFLSRTRFGLAVRATTGDPTVARLMGIPVNRVYRFAWVAAGALAGLAAEFGVVDDYPRRRPDGIDGPQFEE